MHQALQDLATSTHKLPADVDPNWLILGNIRTDVPHIEADRQVSWLHFLPMLGLIFHPVTSLIIDRCGWDEHPPHAMRCRKQPVMAAYTRMKERVDMGLRAGCDPTLSWEARAIRFGCALHTIQDSYCTAHAARIDNGDPHSPLIDMYTYPSRQHPITTSKDSVWQSKDKTAFKPEAAAAITATVAALRIFVNQQPEAIEPFLQQYLAFRQDIADRRHPQ